MAVIGSIRKRSTLLIVIIGVALAAFVLGDFVKGGSGKREIVVGNVAGEKITIMDFNRKVETNITNTKQQRQTDKLEANEQFRIKNDTWNQMVSDILLQKEYDELGLDITADELFELIQGPNPHPLIKQYFADPQTGVYDRNRVLSYLQQKETLPPEAQLQWLEFEKYIKSDRIKQKYDNLISKGYYVPTALARMTFAENNDKANVEYVSKRYSDVSDSLINPTDADYKKQYNEKKERFKQEAFRELNYVVFDIVPSARDIEQATTQVDKIYNEFITTDDVERFVLINSDLSYDSTWKTEGQLPVQIDSVMFNSEIGTVAKPYMVENTFYVSKLADVAYRPDSLKASHILIAFAGAFNAAPDMTRTRQQAQIMADSLMQVIEKSPDQLEILAVELSDDPSAQTNKGAFDWFADGKMVTNFNEAVVNNEIGSTIVTETPYGFHVIRVTDKKEPVKKVRVGTVVNEVIPSNETYQSTYAKASKLASENKTVAEFDIAVEDERLNKRVSPRLGIMDNVISGLTNPRGIVMWAFKEETELGMVSDVFDLEGQFVVAVVTEVGEEGYPALDEIKTRLNPFVYNELKSKIIMDEMAANSNDFARVSEQAGFQKNEMNALTFAARNLQGFGTENEVIGAVFGTEGGNAFGPVAGKSGVFLVNVKSVVKAEDKANYDETITSLERAWSGRIGQNYPFRALEEASDVEDRRYIFY